VGEKHRHDLWDSANSKQITTFTQNKMEVKNKNSHDWVFTTHFMDRLHERFVEWSPAKVVELLDGPSQVRRTDYTARFHIPDSLHLCKLCLSKTAKPANRPVVGLRNADQEVVSTTTKPDLEKSAYEICDASWNQDSESAKSVPDCFCDLKETQLAQEVEVVVYSAITIVLDKVTHTLITCYPTRQKERISKKLKVSAHCKALFYRCYFNREHGISKTCRGRLKKALKHRTRNRVKIYRKIKMFPKPPKKKSKKKYQSRLSDRKFSREISWGVDCPNLMEPTVHQKITPQSQKMKEKKEKTTEKKEKTTEKTKEKKKEKKEKKEKMEKKSTASKNVLVTQSSNPIVGMTPIKKSTSTEDNKSKEKKEKKEKTENK
jgi:hypothetical protein